MRKKKIKLCGLKVPKIWFWFVGRRDGRAEAVIKDEPLGWTSSFIIRYQKGFEAYCAEIWRDAATELSLLYLQMTEYIVKMNNAQQRLELLEENNLEENCDNVRRRTAARNAATVVAIKNEVMKMKEELPGIYERINQLELATQEKLYSNKMLLERKLGVYVRSALYRSNEKDTTGVRLPDAAIPYELYEKSTRIKQALSETGGTL